MSRLWAWGTPVKDMVLTDDRLPLGFTWLDRRHVIVAIDNIWDIHQWPDGICRDYFWVTTDTGFTIDLFRDCLTDTWYVQRLYD